MQTFVSADDRLHLPKTGLGPGEFVTAHDRPSRVEYVLHRLKDRAFPGRTDPGLVDMAPLRRLLAPAFLTFLETA